MIRFKYAGSEYVLHGITVEAQLGDNAMIAQLLSSELKDGYSDADGDQFERVGIERLAEFYPIHVVEDEES